MLRKLIIGTDILLPICSVAQTVRDKLAPVLAKRCENVSKPYELLRRASTAGIVSTRNPTSQAKKRLYKERVGQQKRTLPH
jgi:hypothetical protein